MVKVREDLTGQQFDRLKVLNQAEDYVDPNGVHYAQWLCECSCEEHKRIIVRGSGLRNGTSTSCGCKNKEWVAQMHKNNMKSNKFDLNLEDEHGLYGIGYCTNTETPFYFDMVDYELIKDYCWYEHITTNDYHALETTERGTRKTIRFHYLFGCKEYDHIDRNPLNNRRYNLREATHQENSRNKNKYRNNTSGVTGVCYDKLIDKWRAYIVIDGKSILLGFFINKDDAIKERLEAEKKYFGEFAPQKYLFKEYNII